ncbi:MAG: hypothetical protein JXR37_05640 [Kiritimatiellae bacterium]|nr:hypothetical protein [Kiritimatiellia bacterium]
MRTRAKSLATGLYRRFEGISDRVLYAEHYVWGAGADGPHATQTGITYWPLARMRGAHRIPPRAIRAVIERLDSYAWFWPDPLDVDFSLDTLIQRRLMKPLSLLARRLDGKWERVLLHIVPESVLQRPRNRLSFWWYYGEPWCHRCNKTLFWDPAVEEVDSYRHGDGRVCAQCGWHMPN